MSLDLRQLESFADVAELGSFSAAADRAGLTQPAISQQIRQLERQLGVQLIERTGRRAHLTPAGEDLLVHAHRIREQVELALDALAPHRNGSAGRLRIGTGATACIHLLPEVLGKIRHDMPGVDITVRTGDTPDILRLLEDNAIDAAVVTLPAGGRSIDTIPVYRDELVAVFPPGEPVAAGEITPEFLATKPLLLYKGGNTRKLVDRWFGAAGQTARPVMELASVEAIRQLVGAGLGMAILPRLAVQENNGTQPLQSASLSPVLERQLALALRLDKHMSKPLRALKTALEKHGAHIP